jgi:rSAM/selenodomain-associated transferase 1
MNPATVALFVRPPVPGLVKTRLAATIGDRFSCTLYRAMVLDVLRAVQASGLDLRLFHDGSAPDLLPATWQRRTAAVRPQVDGDLGARMAAAFADCFAAGCDRVLLAGSDLPELDSATLLAAAESLEQCGAVLLPTRDGGYGLFGLRAAAFSPDFFTDIAWSTDRVLTATLLRLQRAGVRAQLLPVQGDIDTINDLRSYCRQPATPARHTNAVLRVLCRPGPGS